nr:hypothetical protein [Oscillospiraceae bacterium]MBQ8245404.1 hypothetical protein [Oscillospiraceae bacterium]
MGIFTIVVVLMSLLLAGLVVAVAKPELAKRITVIFLVLAALGGIFFYGYGYLTVCDNALLALLRMVPALCGMFLGDDCCGDIEDTPLMQNGWMLTLFWIVHCYAIYTTVSAVVTAVGTTAIRKLRLRLVRQDRLHLIYGVNENTLTMGKALSANKQKALVFVGEEDDKERVTAQGGILRSDSHAGGGEKAFLRSIGCGKKRELTLYALREDPAENLRYARALLDSLQELGIAPEQTRLVIRAKEESAVNRLQVTSRQYGYGYVTAVDAAQLAARLLTRNYPPCRTISFDPDAKATEDLEILIIGFGQVGQAVLKSLIMSGQFEGSTFRAAVYAPDCQDVDGRIGSQFDAMFRNYDITLNPWDARSRQLYQHIRERGSKLKYAVICTGSESLNQELAEDIASYCKRLHIALPLYLCSRRGVSACDPDGMVTESHSLYQPELLSNHTLDRMAMLLNHGYQGPTEETPLQTWMRCDYFSRQSCRAAADFTEAMLWAVGKTAEEVKEKGWLLTDKQLENLSRTEHLRWCAFHYCMGFRTMDDAAFAQRGETYRKQLTETGKATIRIGKDMQELLHACLVSWEGLDALSEKEATYTGKRVDYKAMDTDNVLAIPKLLKAMEE